MVLIAPARPFVTDPTTAGPRGTPTSAPTSAPRPPRGATAWSWAIAGLVAGLAAGLAGCNRGPSVHDLTLGSADLSQPERDYFEVAIDFLKQRDEHNLERSAGQTNYYLNRWIRGETADPQWTIDRPLLNTLPDAIRRAPATKELLSDRALTGLEFRTDDVVFLEEARWLHAVAQWVSQQPLPQDLSDWIDQRGLSNRSAKKLAQSALLFDWTVRNIQLDELLPYPKQATAGPQPNGRGPDPKIDWPPPMHGVPGPGYTLDPWHILLYGHGDMYQRARIFVLLARQLRINVVMLGIDTRTGRAQPWLPAAVLDGELFLFDAELGLPIPGPGGRGIATLSEVLDAPSLLESLDVGERYRYRVRGDDLDRVVALIDATPEYLSQRMTLVEQKLEAADQMILSVSASGIRQEVEPCRGIKAVRLWAVPIEAIMYRQARAEIIAGNPELQWQEYVERGVFLGLTPLVKGRRHYLLGNHAKKGDELGATGYLLQSRLPQSQIEALETSRDAQAAMGLRKTPGMSEPEWQGRLQQLKRLQVDAKEHASYWLGIMHMEQGDHAVAVNWLQHRTVETNPEGRWQFGARYNVARCYEALGQIDEARQLYLTDQSPQRHGNLVRARRLDLKAEPTR